MAKGGFSLKSPWTALVHDLLSIPVAWFSAYWLRFNLDTIPQEIFYHAVLMLPVVMMTQAVAFWYFGLYRGVWRFASLPDLVRICKAVLAGCLLSLLALFFVFRLSQTPRAIFPIYGLNLLLCLGGSRFFYRWLKDKKAPIGKAQERVLIVGAGDAGESLCRDLLRKQDPYLPVAFVDDKPRNLGQEIHGVRVVGTTLDIQEVVRKYAIEHIMIALPSANAKDMRRIHALCEATHQPVYTLPGLSDLVEGRVSVKNLRKISLEDLLGRDPISLDRRAIQGSVNHKRVLVTGGAGSIGSELCRQVLKFQIKELIVVDNNEYHLFLLEQELLAQGLNISLQFRLLDVCDEVAVDKLFASIKPEVVFHAAAFKHVPLLEHQIRAAVRNNVLGTLSIAKAAVRSEAEKFILVSTDKAVNPTSVMGATKRAAEMICQHFAQTKTQFITVRFGNVLGSRGSVVETFQQQLEQGGPLTVTHPDMTRFFMTTKEACQLILQAMSLGSGGELFVLDMGEPVKIRYMAEQMIRLSGKTLNDEVQIIFVGLRKGEKLYEELFYKKEQLMATQHTKILKAKHHSFDSQVLTKLLEQLQKVCLQGDDPNILYYLNALVPEYLEPENPTTSKDLPSKMDLEIA